MENSKKIVPRAVYFGIGSFIVFYFVFVVFGTLSGGQAMEALFIFQILLFIVSGYIAGRIAKHDGWLNGLMVGVPLPIIVAIGFALGTQQASMASKVLTEIGMFWLIQSVVLCTLGGFIADVHLRLSKRGL